MGKPYDISTKARRGKEREISIAPGFRTGGASTNCCGYAFKQPPSLALLVIPGLSIRESRRPDAVVSPVISVLKASNSG